MKKRFIVIIIIVAVLAAAVAAVIYFWKTDYDGIKASDIPVTPVNVAGQEIQPTSSSVTVPVLASWQEKIPWAFDILEPALGEYYEKQLDSVFDGEGWKAAQEGTPPDKGDSAAALGLLGEVPFLLDIEMPGPMVWTVNIYYEDESGKETSIYMGGGPAQASDAAAASQNYSEELVLQKQGNYTLYIEGELAAEGQTDPYGRFNYEAGFSVKNPDLVFTAGRTELEQGDVLSIKIENVPDGIAPELESVLGPAIFTRDVPLSPEEDEAGGAAWPAALGPPEGFSNWYAAVPIAHDRRPGEYDVTVAVGEMIYETAVTVEEYKFDFQNMIIDTSIPSVADATSTRAIEEFREKVSPLYPILSEERYWDGYFIMPVDLGDEWFISTQFGEIRITNGNEATRRSHLGMDLAVPMGTPVHAANAGKVLLAEFLLNTGNTVIIDHGGGLKSFYYHMESISTEAGLVIERGALIGAVGSTGYSTGPHLHFEMRIGEQPISPSMLFDSGAGLYSALK